MSTHLAEIERRRTFAIISHPDAGKTTLTEKLLLFGGAIQVAGAVKSNKIKKTATSDFMEIERQRGISVATSVMGFEYRDKQVNILDTPGHQDFAEDTYRTLTAVDSVIVVIDVAKGVEMQTEKLVQVCRRRQTPIIVFINKLDRPGKDAFELLDEVEQKLGIRVRPLSWPIGMGQDFRGVYNLYHRNLNLFSPLDKQRVSDQIFEISDINDEQIDGFVGEDAAAQLREEVELVEGIYEPFEVEKYRKGQISPVFFGSALNNFGVQELLECFLDIAPCPQRSSTDEREVLATEEKFSGFVFKIHANMDPKHRDRIAFLRVCSGKFERNKSYKHVRLGKSMKFPNPTTFMASKKEVVEEAYPGDIVGLYDSGNFKIGDTLTEGETLHFNGIPSFSPELFRYVENADPMKSKQLYKGLDQLMDEGVAQLFIRNMNGRRIIGTVGALQFDVIQYRLEHEYGAICRYEPVPLKRAYWLSSSNREEFDRFKSSQMRNLAKDKHGKDVYLSDSDFYINMLQEQFPSVKFHQTSEFD
jgi:peptide chain release factor 3